MAMRAGQIGQIRGTIELDRVGTLLLSDGNDGSKEEIPLENVITVLQHQTEINGQHEEEYEVLYLDDQDPHESQITSQKRYGLASQKHIESLPESCLKKFFVPRLPKHLSVPPTDGNRNIHVVISVKSGTCEAGTFFNQVIEKGLHALGVSEDQFEVHETSSEESVRNLAFDILAPRANAGYSQTVLLLSGDGGIVDIVNVLFQCPRNLRYVKPTIGLFPLGTGNALANSTGLNDGRSRGFRTFLRGSPHELPTFAVTFSPGSVYLAGEGQMELALNTEGSPYGVLHGAVVCSWALHASLVADSDTTEYRRYGAQRFQMAAKELLQPADGSRPHVYKGRITLFRRDVNGQAYTAQLDRTDHTYILVTLVSNLEEKLKISPDSKPLDGQLRLVHFGKMPSDEVMRVLGSAFAGGKHVHEPGVGYDAIEGMRIDFEESDSRWRRVCVDGKIIRVGERGWLEIRRDTREVVNLVVDRQ